MRASSPPHGLHSVVVAGLCDQHLYGRTVACMSVYGGSLSLERQCIASGCIDKMYYSNSELAMCGSQIRVDRSIAAETAEFFSV